MTDARPFLIDTLRHVIKGGDVTNDELDAALLTRPASEVLSGKRGMA